MLGTAREQGNNSRLRCDGVHYSAPRSSLRHPSWVHQPWQWFMVFHKLQFLACSKKKKHISLRAPGRRAPETVASSCTLAATSAKGTDRLAFFAARKKDGGDTLNGKLLQKPWLEFACTSRQKQRRRHEFCTSSFHFLLQLEASVTYEVAPGLPIADHVTFMSHSS